MRAMSQMKAASSRAIATTATLDRVKLMLLRHYATRGTSLWAWDATT
jgi:hypothetical protein